MPQDVVDKKVLEVGSLDVNGSLRSFIESKNPSVYLGVDIRSGPGVDLVCDANDLVFEFGEHYFDLIVCTEMLEHEFDWRGAISNMKRTLTPGGVLVLTTRSHPFHYHGYPHDYWRFNIDDMQNLFSDLIILELEKDPEIPGVFIKARKGDPFVERCLKDYHVYAMRKPEDV